MSKVRPVILFILSLVFGLVGVGLDAWRDSPEEISKIISRNLSTELLKLEQEQGKIIQNPSGIVWSQLDGTHFLVDSLRIVAWSRNDFSPDARMLRDSFSMRLIQISAGDFLIKKTLVSHSHYLISVLPLYKKYLIVNKYLTPRWNQSVFQNFSGRIVTPDFSTGESIKVGDKILFKVLLSDNTSGHNVLALLSVLLAIIFLMLGIGVVLKRLHGERRFQLVFIISTVVFVGIRVLMIRFDFPARWHASPIFSPQEFASSSYNASLGDLLLNSLVVLILCAYALFTYSKWPIVKQILATKGGVRWVWSSVFILSAIFSFLYPFLFIETIFHNSRISLDLTQTIVFDWVRILSFGAVAVGTLSSFCFTHVFLQLSKSLSSKFITYVIALLLACILFATYFIVESRNYWISVIIVVPYIILFYHSKLSSSLARISYLTFLYFFLAVSAYAVQSALSVKRFVEEDRVESQFRFASGYLIGRDVLAEYLLNETSKRIAKDAFIQSRLASPLLSKSPVRQKIKQVFLNSYFDRYDVKILLYNSMNEPFDEQTEIEGEGEFLRQGTATEYPGVYFVRSTGVQTGKRYFSTIPITRFDQVVANIVLDISLKRIIPQNVYPELLVDSRFNEYFENRDKSFAFISDKSIVSSFGNFNYEKDFDFTLLDDPEFFKEGIRKDGFIHIGTEDESGRVAVVSTLSYPVFFIFTNFSFFFVLGIFVIGLGMVAYGLNAWRLGSQINYAARIQLYIYLAFAVPLVIVTITTLNRVSSSAENQLNSDFQSKSRLLGENIVPALSAFVNDPDNSRSELESQLINMAKFSNVDMSIYNPSGTMIISSQPVIVENQLTSNLMNRNAWERIFQTGDNTLIENEQIGDLRFNNSYFGLKSPESGLLIGVLSVPFFESALSLESTQISVLANILTVFVVIFILFSILSFFVVDSLTFPLRFITRTLSRTTLTGTNTPLEWKPNDEIGLMVTEYNRMLENLDQSKIELARSQKESAWREIAKQVAHEIKNPLTPMKLTLQQMDQVALRGELEKDRVTQSIKTLLAQVEILNDIASSFSAFARMPAPILQRIDLVALLKRSIDLYANYEDGNVAFDYSGKPLFVNGDEQLLDRVFSNIILNAFQSRKEDAVMVDVKLTIDADWVMISFQDNGTGIDEELRDKIFAPYFSTKKSGSGLGLAIAKQGIEQSGGEIWFETKPGEGTTFFIRLLTVK
jgi:two-component system, NtrC family, nitrogen regulation sensor histidine kinase NtrY